MQSCDFVILSVVEGSPGRVPLAYNQIIAINKLRRKGRFREIAHTRNAPLLSLERQQHPPPNVPSGEFHSTSPTATHGILAYALVSPKAGEGIDARAFAANTAARLRTPSNHNRTSAPF